VFKLVEVQPITQQGIDSKNKMMHEVREESAKREINFLNQELEFFRGFTLRQFLNKEANEAANRIIADAEKEKKVKEDYLERCKDDSKRT